MPVQLQELYNTQDFTKQKKISKLNNHMKRFNPVTEFGNLCSRNPTCGEYSKVIQLILMELW